MNTTFPVVYLARHGETAWSITGQHTGLTDLPLTERGERDARSLGKKLAGKQFELVLTSGLQRADRTCVLAGFQAEAIVDANLVEWNYGDYEGRRSAEIRDQRPDWQIFRDGCPGGETIEQVGARADQVLTRIRSCSGDVLLFSSGHILRVLTARWLGLQPQEGKNYLLGTASLSLLGYEHSLSEPVIRLWNDTSHIGP